ncbi:unnamed protein product [Coccothraustes coccothraustes]
METAIEPSITDTVLLLTKGDISFSKAFNPASAPTHHGSRSGATQGGDVLARMSRTPRPLWDPGPLPRPISRPLSGQRTGPLQRQLSERLFPPFVMRGVAFPLAAPSHDFSHNFGSCSCPKILEKTAQNPFLAHSRSWAPVRTGPLQPAKVQDLPFHRWNTGSGAPSPLSHNVGSRASPGRSEKSVPFMPRRP